MGEFICGRISVLHTGSVGGQAADLQVCMGSLRLSPITSRYKPLGNYPKFSPIHLLHATPQRPTVKDAQLLLVAWSCLVRHLCLLGFPRNWRYVLDSLLQCVVAYM